jgi:hypothetical protein
MPPKLAPRAGWFYTRRLSNTTNVLIFGFSLQDCKLYPVIYKQPEFQDRGGLVRCVLLR